MSEFNIERGTGILDHVESRSLFKALFFGAPLD